MDSGSQSIDAGDGGVKRMKQMEQKSNGGLKGTQREEELSREVERLREELDRSHKEWETLLDIINRLTQVPK